MNTDHPADLAPLSYGSGLALGLMLILGLPSEPRKAAVAGENLPRVPAGDATAKLPLHRMGTAACQ